jgi:hypothetical protein
MAIKGHCVVCGYHRSDGPVMSVEFADYNPYWEPPPFVGWSNELGVTEPPGVGLFCPAHFKRAKELIGLPSAEAVDRLKGVPLPCAVGGCPNPTVDTVGFAWVPDPDPERLQWFCDEHADRAEVLSELPAAEALPRLSNAADLERMKATPPLCAVAGCPNPAAGSIEFAGLRHQDSSRDPERFTWCFCGEHLKRAKKLRKLPAAEAIRQLSARPDPERGPRAWLRTVFK